MLEATLDSSVCSLEIEQVALSRWLQPGLARAALRSRAFISRRAPRHDLRARSALWARCCQPAMKSATPVRRLRDNIINLFATLSDLPMLVFSRNSQRELCKSLEFCN
jgi:hypothetical protein